MADNRQMADPPDILIGMLILAALREIAALGFWDGDSAMSIARTALEGKDE